MDSLSDSSSVSERILASPVRVPPSPSRFSMSPRIDRVGSVHLNMNDAARATQNFSPSLRLGEGGFGTVYKARLQDGQIVAIKLAKKAHYEALRSEFESEVELLATINHRNLVKLLGFVDKGDDCLIITEYVANGTLREHLDGTRGNSLDFNQRLEISIDVAHGLTYLHLYAGVSIIEDGCKDGITMELEMQWDGNPSIILDIKTRVGVGLPVQVKNIAFTGVFRLIFKPLVDELPCFGAVCFSLRHKKKLDLTLKVVGGDISAIPGISDAIESTIRDAVEDSITWPVRIVIPIIPGDYSDLELKPVGRLEVKLVQAKELTNKDIIGKSDPYAVLYVRPIRSRTKTSKTISNQLNPVWNEHFEFIVEDASTQHLVVKIFDDEGLQASELIGCAQIRLNELEPGKVKDVWLKLVKDLDLQRDNKNRGQVHLELLYCPFGMKNGFTNPFAPEFSMTSLEKVLNSGEEDMDSAENGGDIKNKRREVITRGVLAVTVISADDLAPADVMGKADPYVVVSMKKTAAKNKTRVANDNLNPVWNQTFDFVVEDGLHDMLILEVWDHDTFGKDYMGRCILTLTRVILEGEYKDSFQLDGAKSGKLNLNLKWMPQPIYRDS